MFLISAESIEKEDSAIAWEEAVLSNNKSCSNWSCICFYPKNTFLFESIYDTLNIPKLPLFERWRKSFYIPLCAYLILFRCFLVWSQCFVNNFFFFSKIEVMLFWNFKLKYELNLKSERLLFKLLLTFVLRWRKRSDCGVSNETLGIQIMLSPPCAQYSYLVEKISHWFHLLQNQSWTNFKTEECKFLK